MTFAYNFVTASGLVGPFFDISLRRPQRGATDTQSLTTCPRHGLLISVRRTTWTYVLPVARRDDRPWGVRAFSPSPQRERATSSAPPPRGPGTRPAETAAYRRHSGDSGRPWADRSPAGPKRAGPPSTGGPWHPVLSTPAPRKQQPQTNRPKESRNLIPRSFHEKRGTSPRRIHDRTFYVPRSS